MKNYYYNCIRKNVCTTGSPRWAFVIKGVEWESLQKAIEKCLREKLYKSMRGFELNYYPEDDGEYVYNFLRMWNEWGTPGGGYGCEEWIDGEDIPASFILKGDKDIGHLFVIPVKRYNRNKITFDEDYGEYKPFLTKYYEFFAGFTLEVLNVCKKDDTAQPRLETTDALKWYETLVPEKERKKIDKQLEKEEEKRRKEEEK